MKFPLFLLRKHWKNHRPIPSVITTTCYVVSSGWLIIQIVSFFFEWFEKLSRYNLWMFSTILIVGLLTGITIFLWRCKKLLTICEKINGKDIYIEIRVGNIFEADGALVISTNTTFDIDTSGGLISTVSLQGQFTKLYYDKLEHLDHDIKLGLVGKEPNLTNDDRKGKKEHYEIGTVVKVKPKNRVTYLVAVAHMNNIGKAGESSKEMMMECLGKLWHHISERGELEPLAVPVLGTGLARCPMTREDMIREIIKSFIAACSEKKFSEKLTIVISENDYRKHDIDLQELGNYLVHHCKYVDIWDNKELGKGVAIS